MDYKYDGFLFARTPFENTDAIYIQSHRIIEAIGYIRKKNIRYIKIHPDRYINKGIKCIGEIAGQIEGIEISINAKDLSPIADLHNLRHLFLVGATDGQVVDFANFPDLVECNMNWSSSFLNLQQCTKLKKLTVTNLDENDLWRLKDLVSLECLELCECASLQNLGGLEYLKNLREIRLCNCKNLTSVEQLRYVSGTLVNLSVVKSKNLNDYSPIGSLNKLEYLVIKDSGSSPDARFLEPLQSLQCGHINIYIVDGQVEKLLELPVKFRNYRHYSHKNVHLVKTTPNGSCVIRKKTIRKIV